MAVGSILYSFIHLGVAEITKSTNLKGCLHTVVYIVYIVLVINVVNTENVIDLDR